jgi:hypothetical protein
VARTDPTESGGLFTGRPAASIRFRESRPDGRRRRADQLLALFILLLETLLCLSLLGPQPLGWLWVGSQVQYLTGAVTVGISAIMLGCLASLMFTMVLAKRLDHWWKLVRRAAGYHQERGAIELILAACVFVVVVVFSFWFFIIQGPGPSIAPMN